MKKIKILLVEDRPITQKLVESLLSGLNHTLKIVASGEVALEELSKTEYDVIILDIILAGRIDGIEMLRKAKAQSIKVAPVIVLSEHYNFKNVGETYQLGAFAFIPKTALDENFKEIVIAAANKKIDSESTKVRYCFKHNQNGCNAEFDVKSDTVFVGIQFKLEDVYLEGIKPVIESLNLHCQRADEMFKSADYSCKICAIIQDCKLAVFDISEHRPNVFLEIGFACALGKEIFILKRKDIELPSNLSGFETIEYDNIPQLKERLYSYLEPYRLKTDN